MLVLIYVGAGYWQVGTLMQMLSNGSLFGDMFLVTFAYFETSTVVIVKGKGGCIKKKKRGGAG